jgi:hypothetical protein
MAQDAQKVEAQGQGEGNFEIGRILHLKSESPKIRIGLFSV